MKDVGNNVKKHFLVVSFVKVPKFGKVVIWDSIELTLQDGVQGDYSVVHFFGIIVHCIYFQLLGSNGSIWNGLV